MSRVYAYPDDGSKRILVKLTCDEPGCSEEIKPNPDIASSGWVKVGGINFATREKRESDYCPSHRP